MTRSNFCCALLIGSLSLACGQPEALLAADPQPKSTVVLSVKHMCCAKESVPAIKELSKVQGVGRVSVDYKTRTLRIEPTAATAPSPRAVWEAAERVKIEPIRLATPEGVYTSKPRR